MADRTGDHADHDLLLVAGLADRDLAATEREAALAQVEACADCAELQHELAALAQAVHDLPAIPRPRDFTLRPEDVQRLRPNVLRRMIQAFGTARDGVSRPLAVGLTTLGLVGILVGAMPALSIGQGDAASRDTTLSMQAPAGSGGDSGQLAGEGSTEGTVESQPEAPTERSTFLAALPTANAPILLGGAALLAVGLGLGAGRLVVRRRRGNHPGSRSV